MTMQENNNKTILYADYSERNIRSAKEAIDPLGFGDFIRCDDREKTVELVSSLKPDIVLVGLYLDGMRGISTIRSIRESSTATNRHGKDVTILLGAPKLDRRAMREAVDAGIEGIFRQPVDPARLRKIITSVMKKPRRFVLQNDYFGPARPQDLAKDETVPVPEAENVSETKQRRHSDKARAPASASVTIKPNGRRRSDTAVKPEPTSQPDSTNKQTFDDGELAGVANQDKESLDARNIKAAIAARALLKPDPVPQKPKPKPKSKPQKVVAETTETEEDTVPVAASPKEPAKEEPIPASVSKEADVSGEPESEVDAEPEIDEEELVEIDLQAALVDHKLWVDTGGKEGSVMAIEHADLRDADLEGIDLSRCGLRFASFRNANCKNAVLRRCDLTAADFVESNLESANLAASRLSGARFNEATLRNTVFLGSDLSNACFKGMHLINCDLSGTNLAGADFRDADLSGANGLFAEQIQRARVNTNTRLPRNLKLRS